MKGDKKRAQEMLEEEPNSCVHLELYISGMKERYQSEREGKIK